MKKIPIIALSISSLFAFAYAKDEVKQYSTAGFYQVEDSPRTVYNFNVGWRFLKSDTKGAEKVDFDDSNWVLANLPHGLELLPESASGCVNYQGVAWYRKEFQVPDLSKRTVLYFEAVMGKTKVWINGQLATENFGGYLPFAVDATSYLKEGKNIIALMTDNSDDPSYPIGRPQSKMDLAYLGGIYRDAYLIQTSPIRVTFPEISETVAGAGVFVATLKAEDNKAEVQLRTEVQNFSKANKSVKVTNIFEDANGKEIKTVSKTVQLKAGQKQQLDEQVKLDNVKLWHPDSPNLNFVKTIVECDGKIVDSMRTRIALRLFDMRGAKGLYINNKAYDDKLVGVNRHQDYVYVGNALPNSGQWRDAQLIRDGGSRIVRAGHYPLDSAFYDACDTLGLLATTANPGWHFFNHQDKTFEKHLYKDTRRLVRKDRNVASILMWETALNETPNQPDYALKEMHRLAHEEYPFVGMHTVADYKEAIKGGLDMHYHGHDKNVCSFNREYGDGSEVDSWDSQNAISRIKRAWGEAAMLGQVTNQAKVLGFIIEGEKFRIGGTKWAGIDHQRGGTEFPFWGGLLDMYRIPKYAYYMYKCQYAPDYKVEGVNTGPMIYVANELSQLSQKDVYIFSNCDELKITWLGEDKGTIKPTKEGIYSGHKYPPFIAKGLFDFKAVKAKYGKKLYQAELIVEGLIDGKVVAKEVRKYPLGIKGLRLELDAQGVQLQADGSDFVPVRCYIVDEKGTTKPLSHQHVYFEVEGNGEVIGGQSIHSNPMLAEFGVATALIRSTLEAGDIKITAHTNALKSDSITIKSVKPKMENVYSKEYANSSKKENYGNTVILDKNEENVTSDVAKLQELVRKLSLDVSHREQEIEELEAQLTSGDSK